ncbi:MAG: hypothetical protein QF670_03610 [Alphaproteobacteria bacterium]|jgi:hypothetical protein|nr:hypothetical protein [Alphaproteobacteria bacterium]HJN22233.1 hypothetical protein [Alphaproteobacteria bacterium]
MHAGAWRLADDKQACACTRPQHRARAERQVVGTELTGARLAQHRDERFARHHPDSG